MCSFRALLVAVPRQQGTQHSWAQREGSILSLCQAAIPFALGSCIPPSQPTRHGSGSGGSLAACWPVPSLAISLVTLLASKHLLPSTHPLTPGSPPNTSSEPAHASQRQLMP